METDPTELAFAANAINLSIADDEDHIVPITAVKAVMRNRRTVKVICSPQALSKVVVLPSDANAIARLAEVRRLLDWRIG